MRLPLVLTVCVVSVIASSCKRDSDSERRAAAERARHGPKTLPPPNKGQLQILEKAVAATEAADADIRGFSALTGLMFASTGRIPPQLADDILALGIEGTSGRMDALRRLFNNSAWLFDEVCGQEFESVLAQAQAQANGDHGETARHVWRECRLDRYSLIGGEAELVESSSRTGPEPMLAYFVYAYLEEHGGAHALETKLLHVVALGKPTKVAAPW
jgi:hypothetical protein